jgi:hypothetical protein
VYFGNSPASYENEHFAEPCYLLGNLRIPVIGPGSYNTDTWIGKIGRGFIKVSYELVIWESPLWEANELEEESLTSTSGNTH